ncbi:MAG: BON domain-containing protein, partial [Pseudomonadota bacterium]
MTALVAVVALLLAHGEVRAQSTESPAPSTQSEPDQPEVSTDQVDVRPTAADGEIVERLDRIMQATGWFTDPSVEVRDGVVLLDGRTETDRHREWAGNLARRTQDMAAVVNRIEVIPAPRWDFSPALKEMRKLARHIIQSIPLLLAALVIIPLARLAARWNENCFRPRVASPLLARIIA